ncbi:MAG: PIN domain-containing protein [Candidatus Aenigmarchaeota archaeon]|nr:PIN domain-containing protein [Candidatus Aenigmarchaeota archaeon]
MEYFEGTDKGEIVKKIIEDPKNEIIINIVNISELVSVIERKNIDTNKLLDVVFSISTIYYGDKDFSIYVGKRHAEIKSKIKDFGLLDAFVLSTGDKLNAKIVTGDPHFKNRKNVILL